MKRSPQTITTVLTTLLAIWVILLVPFRVIGYGFLPPDDALRHSAKAISSKPWDQILILRDDIKMDSHPGWHAILGIVHRITHWDAHSLVLFSVIALFILFSITPLFFLRYSESWLISLSILSVFAAGWIFRLFLGRPYIFTMAVFSVICFLWPSLKAKDINFKTVIFLTIAIALSTWIHCSWYLFLLPIASFFLAREWRAGMIFSICAILGIITGACSTGHPIIFIRQTITHLFLAFTSVDIQRLLVGEFQPALPDVNIIMMVVGLLGWQYLRGKWNRKIIDNPVFILAVLCFILGAVSRRITLDLGIPVIAFWLASGIDEFFGSSPSIPLRRIILSITACFILYLFVTSDVESRWSRYKPVDYLSAENSEQKQWLPDPGGIIYSDDMGIFYTTFFKNPKANWRYILGFEPALMPPPDLKIYRDIQQNRYTYAYFYPWVNKMRPQDRLIIRGGPDNKPKIPELEWYYVALSTWSGRLPRNPQAK